MNKIRLRRIVAMGGSLAAMAVGGSYAAGAFAQGGAPAPTIVKHGQSVNHHRLTVKQGQNLRSSDPSDDATPEPGEDETEHPVPEPGEDVGDDHGDNGGHGGDEDGH